MELTLSIAKSFSSCHPRPHASTMWLAWRKTIPFKAQSLPTYLSLGSFLGNQNGTGKTKAVHYYQKTFLASIRNGRTWAVAVRGGSYESLFLLNSGRFAQERREIQFWFTLKRSKSLWPKFFPLWLKMQLSMPVVDTTTFEKNKETTSTTEILSVAPISLVVKEEFLSGGRVVNGFFSQRSR